MTYISLWGRARHAVKDCRSIRTALSRFKREEDGSLVIFGLFILVLMLMAGGMAVDFMRFESERVRLQGTLDRAVLAAADLDQTLSPQAVVEDYFAKAGMSAYLADVNVSEGLNFRTVDATALMDVNMLFLPLMGIEQIAAPAAATAEERFTNVEISLVLDISGSMGSNNKIRELRSASQEFVETVIKVETTDKISINLVPYTAQVNAGAEIFNLMTTNHRHNFSHCLDFEIADFDSVVLDPSTTYEQMQHFESGYGSGYINNPGCPDEWYEEIVPFNQDIGDLQDTLSEYTSRANTAIHIGMKWGVGMLDPAFRPVVNGLIANGTVDSEFAGRPADYDPAEGEDQTLKTIVLMTDGVNVDTRRIVSWAYDTPSEYAHWNRYELYYYTSSNRFVESYGSNLDNSDFYYTKFQSWEADAMLSNICDAAKEAGILIWTIGFEVSNHGADVMLSCASSSSHFFRVNGRELSEAFESIASQINQLRLTQ